jgi:hypothetical protein
MHHPAADEDELAGVRRPGRVGAVAVRQLAQTPSVGPHGVDVARARAEWVARSGRDYFAAAGERDPAARGPGGRMVATAPEGQPPQHATTQIEDVEVGARIRLGPRAPLNTSLRPSGDQAGSPSSAVCCASRRKSVPSLRITASRVPASSASRLPSGDQAGERYSTEQSPRSGCSGARQHQAPACRSATSGDRVQRARPRRSSGHWSWGLA